MFGHQFLLENLEMNRETRKFINNLDEAATGTAMDNAVAKMYEYAVNKYNKIDLGTIPDSKGDITRFSGYKIMKETLDSLDRCTKISDVVDFEDLRTVQQSLAYLEKNKIEFSKAYISNSYMIIMIYNTMVYSILASTNLLITEWVEYTKNPQITKIRLSKTEKSINGDYLLIKGLKDFNTACEKGEMGKFMAQVNKNKDKFIGVSIATVALGALGAAGSILAIATIIVPVIREIIYSVFNLRMKVSELLKNQSEFVKLNAESLSTNTNLSALDRKRVEKKQLQAAKKLQDLSDKIAVKFEEADKKGKKELDKRIDVKDLQNTFSSTVGTSDSDDSNNSGFLL